MKTPARHLILLIVLSASLAAPALGQPGGAPDDVPAPARQPAGKPPRGSESRLLQHFLSMEADELAKLRQTIERIEKMSPEEKEGLRRRMKDLEAMDPGKIEAMRKAYQAIPKEKRQAMRQRWDAMTPAEQADWRRRLRGLSPVDRRRIFEEEGFLPGKGPRQKPGGGPRGGETPPPGS